MENEMTNEVKQALERIEWLEQVELFEPDQAPLKEALAIIRRALEQSESQLRAVSSRLKASEIEQQQSWSRANEAEAEQEKLLAYAKTIQPGAHSVYEVLDELKRGKK